MLEPDPIIQEIHNTRERIHNECIERGISILEYLKGVKIPEGMTVSKLQPRKIDFSKIEALKASRGV